MSLNVRKKEFVHPDGGYGWIIVTAGIIVNTSVNALVQCFGVIFAQDFKEKNVTVTQTAFLLHLQYSIMCITSLLGSPLLKKYDFRQVAFMGTTLMCLGIFLTSFCDTYNTLIFTVAILVGVGQGILTPALYIATNTYFKKRLTLAVCYSVSGTSLGPIFWPQICNLLLNSYGVHGCVLILSGISFNAFAGCLLLRPVEIPQKINEDKATSEKLIESIKDVYKETTIPIPKNDFWEKLSSIFNLELLKERGFIVIVLGLGISSAVELNTILMLPFALVELSKFDTAEVGHFMSVLSTADVIGRLTLPILAHKTKLTPKTTYGLSLIVSVTGKTILAIFSYSKSVILTCAVILGLAKGAKAVFQSILLPKYVPLEKLAPATGLLMVFNGIVSLILGPIIGLVHDVTNTYLYVFHSASIISISCVILWVVEGVCRKRQPAVI